MKLEISDIPIPMGHNQLINLKNLVKSSDQLNLDQALQPKSRGKFSYLPHPEGTSRLGCKWFHGAGAKAKAFTAFTLDDEGNICATVIANIPPKEWPVRINWHLTLTTVAFFRFFQVKSIRNDGFGFRFRLWGILLLCFKDFSSGCSDIAVYIWNSVNLKACIPLPD